MTDALHLPALFAALTLAAGAATSTAIATISSRLDSMP